MVKLSITYNYSHHIQTRHFHNLNTLFVTCHLPFTMKWQMCSFFPNIMWCIQSKTALSLGDLRAYIPHQAKCHAEFKLLHHQGDSIRNHLPIVLVLQKWAFPSRNNDTSISLKALRHLNQVRMMENLELNKTKGWRAITKISNHASTVKKKVSKRD